MSDAVPLACVVAAVSLLTLALSPSLGAAPAETRLIVTRDRLRDEPISPFIYGNFIEFLDHHVQGMRAQMLDDVSFEGILPPAEWCHWQRDKDVDDHPWLPTGEGAAEVISEGAFNGTKCCRLQSPGGLRQGGLSIHAGKKYTLSLYARGEGPLTVSLGRDLGPFVASYAEAQITDIGPEWSKHTVVLTPDTTDVNAELSLRLAGPGTLYLDQVTLLPEDHVVGWRRDVVDAVRALKPNCLRFGGSAVIYYDWKLGIGDPDRRVPFPNQPWGRMEPNDVGMDEFLQFCELVGAEPLVCASYNVGGPEDAAAQVEYCNGDASTKWGRLRAENGHPEPYHVRLWQVGNEQAGEEYEARLASYCRAMRAADPSIEICSSFPTDALLERAADLIDYLSPHHYTPSLQAFENDLQAQRDRVARLGRGRHIRLAITEWNHTAGDWGGARALLATQYNALFCARALQVYQRNSDLVAIANRSNLTNSWWAGVVQTTRDSLFVTPAYYTMQLMSTHCGAWPLKVAGPVISPLDVMATTSDDGSRLTITVVNDSPDAVTATLDLSAHLKASRRGQCWLLAAAGPNEMNDAPRPNHVHPIATRPSVQPTFRHEYPAWSLTVLAVRL
jgi:alpha-N-arabinofuranosidase